MGVDRLSECDLIVNIFSLVLQVRAKYKPSMRLLSRSSTCKLLQFLCVIRTKDIKISFIKLLNVRQNLQIQEIMEFLKKDAYSLF